jgi:diguanylate cyclase (GGDEF)-like protein/PAS domain S-box-containing protein
LLGLVALPFVLGAVLAGAEAADQYQLTGEANRLRYRVERAVALGELLEQTQVEQGASHGVIAVRDLGWARAEVDARLGHDPAEELGRVRARLDRSVAALDPERSPPQIALLPEELALVRAGLDRGELDAVALQSAYERLGAVVSDQLRRDLRAATVAASRLGGGHQLAAGLDLLRDLHAAAASSARWQALAAGVGDPDPGDALDLVGAVAAHQDVLTDLERRTPALLADPRWIGASRGGELRRDLSTRLLASTVGGDAVGDEERSELVRSLRRLAAEEGRRSVLLAGLIDEVTAEVQRSAAEQGLEAGRRLTLTVATALAVLLGVTVLALRTARSIARPVELLGARATSAVAGTTPVMAPVPDGAPLEVREADRALRELQEALRVLGEQAAALANGEVDAVALRDRIQGPLGAVMTATLGRLESVTRELRRSEQWSRGIIEAAAEAIVLVDDELRVVSANSAACRLLGRTELEGTVLTEHLEGRRPAAELFVGELTVRRADGERVPVLVSSSRLALDDDAVTVVVCRDISDRKQLEERLAHQAVHDQLTGLWNRVGLLEHLEARVSAGDTLGLVYLDLDRFGDVNDDHGHLVGDEVLREVGRRLRDTVRGRDRVARLGGDEFVVAVEVGGDDHGEYEAGLIRFSERLLRELVEPIVTSVGPMRLAASFGVAVAHEGISAMELLRRADVALYEAKGDGRSLVRVFSAEVAARDERRRGVEQDLRRALDDGDIRLEYEPVVELATGRVMALDAVPVWDHPTRGRIAADVFVPVAERSSLVLELDRWAIAQAAHDLALACRQPSTAHWSVSVNVSARHLAEGHLTPSLREAFERTGIGRGRLQIEITESYALGEWLTALPGLHEADELGVSLALDAFGTGYSNLTHLLRLPLATICIDRSFVASIDQPGGRGIVAAITGFARIAGIEVVAAGVDEAAQRVGLLELGCGRGRGRLLGRPRPIEELLAVADAPVLS